MHTIHWNRKQTKTEWKKNTSSPHSSVLFMIVFFAWFCSLVCLYRSKIVWWLNGARRCGKNAQHTSISNWMKSKNQNGKRESIKFKNFNKRFYRCHQLNTGCSFIWYFFEKYEFNFQFKTQLRYICKKSSEAFIATFVDIQKHNFNNWDRILMNNSELLFSVFSFSFIFSYLLFAYSFVLIWKSLISMRWIRSI